jgi:hypothetical protein
MSSPDITDITDIAVQSGRHRVPEGLAAAGVRHGVGPLAAERALPVPDACADLFPEGGLVRGRTLACAGSAARSLAMALVAPAVTAGAWLAAVDLDDLGAEAMAEAGVPLRRVVRVAASAGGVEAARWAERVGAALDGFEVVLLPDRRLPDGLWRRLAQRVRSSEAVVVVLAPSSPALPVDTVLTVGHPMWVGIGHGSGRLLGRRVEVAREGRRAPLRRATHLWLPHPSGQPMAAVASDTAASDTAGSGEWWRRAV